MRSLIILLLGMLPVTAHAAGEHVSIWERYPALICKGETMTYCAEAGACTRRSASAVYVINFKAGTIKAAVSREVSNIVYKANYGILGYDSVITDTAGSFGFGEPVLQPFGSPAINGVVVTGALPKAFSMWLTCRPQ